MEYRSFIIRDHVAHDVVEQIAEEGLMQFVDVRSLFVLVLAHQCKILRHSLSALMQMQGDLTAFKREYTPYVRRCGELEGILHEFSKSMEAQQVAIVPRSKADFQRWKVETLSAAQDRRTLLEIVEERIKEKYSVFRRSISMRNEFAPALYRMIEQRETVAQAMRLFQFDSSTDEGPAVDTEQEVGMSLAQMDAVVSGGASLGASASAPSSGDAGSSALGGALHHQGESESEYRFRHIAGVVLTTDEARFERLVVRASKRQAYVRFSAIEDKDLMDAHLAPVKKTVFLVFYRLPSLSARLERLCDSFGTRHSVPQFSGHSDARPAVLQSVKGLESEIRQQLYTLREWRSTLKAELTAMADVWELYRLAVQRDKAVYAALNLFTRSSAEMLHVKGWVRTADVVAVERVLLTVNTPLGGGAPITYIHRTAPAPWPTPPTFFATNDLTRPFQVMVDTFGVPRYREINPALFTAVTFPFIFGMMYGDVGHASVLLGAALWMIWKEGSIKQQRLGDISSMAFNSRYMLVLMSLFGIYCGMIYNDFFGFGIAGFESRWEFPCNNCTTAVRVDVGGSDVYPFGTDPTWHVSTNQLAYYNSLKMKMSIVFGVTHMMFGLCLRATNDVYFGDYLDLFAETLPQMLFLMSLFGYMSLLILMKWSINWFAPGASQPPNLIDMMIGMVLSPGTVQNAMYEGQATVQVVLLLIAVVTVPWMLFIKPCLQRRWAAAAARGHFTQLHEQEAHELLADDASDSSGHTSPLRFRGGGAEGAFVGSGVGSATQAHGQVASPVGSAPPAAKHLGTGHGEEEFDFTDAMVHSGIETIEFVLGGVSNTASYLRLWALSLAHSELAAVFWGRAFQATLETHNTVFVFVGYAVFAAATIGVLLIMDVLECVLHALRLHWVEFQSKFYKADGHKFEPLSLEQVCEEGQPTT
jgi:V-type H+-transporting ATPase subunit a